MKVRITATYEYDINLPISTTQLHELESQVAGDKIVEAIELGEEVDYTVEVSE